VDGNLIEAEKFEHVKTQGIVVGKKASLGYRNDLQGGFLRVITTGIGNLLQVKEEADGENSGKKSSSSFKHGTGESIPIFSTPQSLLFVDLKLQPGESKCFLYTIKIPDTIPPSFRGKS